MCCISYPTGNTCRHMGQLSSAAPPPAAAPPSPLTILCTSSSSLSSTTSSLFSGSFCRETRLSDTLSWFVRSCLLTGPDCSPPALQPSSPPTVEGPADAAAPTQLWRDGCGLLAREDSCLSGRSDTGLICTERSCWEELSRRRSGLDEVL